MNFFNSKSWHEFDLCCKAGREMVTLGSRWSGGGGEVNEWMGIGIRITFVV